MGEARRRDNGMQRQGRDVATVKGNTATRATRTVVERTPVVEELPPDQFNVVVENDMDRARLLWLVNKIGEAKLRKSVAKYQNRWPGQQPFVSTLLKWYNLRVPVAVYAPVRIPVYWLYLLYTCDGSEVKVGMTGNWPWRAYNWVPLHHAVSDVFDLDRSRAFLVGGNKAEVLRRERAIKRAFAPWRSRPADGWNNGYTEWFSGDWFEDLVAMAVSIDAERDLVVQTLRSALEISRQLYPYGCAAFAHQS